MQNLVRFYLPLLILLTSHGQTTFDSDQTAPFPIAADRFVNGEPIPYAKVGDVVTLALEMSEPVTTPIVNIGGRDASVTGADTSFYATFTVSESDIEGSTDILVSGFSDNAGNSGASVNLGEDWAAINTEPIAAPSDPAALNTDPIVLILDFTPPQAEVLQDHVTRVGDTMTGRFGVADFLSGIDSYALWVKKPGTSGWEPETFLELSTNPLENYPPLGEWTPDTTAPSPTDPNQPYPLIPLDQWEPETFFDPDLWEPETFMPTVFAWTYTADAGPGIYQFAIVAADAAGNTSPLPTNDEDGVAVVWNNTANAPFTYDSIGEGRYLFPMTNEQTIALDFSPGAQGGPITVERKLGLPTDLSWPFVPPDPDIILNEYLDISGSFTGGTVRIEWTYATGNSPSFAGNFNTLYRFGTDGTLLNHYPAVPDGNRLVADGIEGFSRWIAGVGVISSYDRWVETFELETPRATPEASYSGDGVPNLIKYALGLDPTAVAADTARLPVFSIEDVVDIGSGVSEPTPHTVFRFLRHLDRSDVLITAEYSTNLVDWFPLSDDFDFEAPFDPESDLEPRRAVRPRTETETKTFFRLKVEIVE